MIRILHSDPSVSDWRDILTQLIGQCRDGDTVLLSPGRYFLSGKVTVREKNGLVIRGEGAELIGAFDPGQGTGSFSGLFSFEGCRDLRLEGLTIDTDQPVNAAGEVTGMDLPGASFDVRLYEGCVMDGRQTVFAVNSMDADGSPDYRFASYGVMPYETVREGVIRVFCADKHKEALRRLTIGSGMCFRFGVGSFDYLQNACLSFRDCDDTVLSGLTVHSSPGFMTVVFPRCHNFTVLGCRVICPAGIRRLMASNVDGFHFLGLSGRLVMRNCRFDGLGDDAVNLHSTAGWVAETDGGHAVLENRRFHRLLPGDWCRKGDRIAVYGSDFLRKGTLLAEEYREGALTFSVCEGNVSAGDTVANTAFFPSCEITDCTVRNSRARALVLQTENIRVSDCRFYGISGAGILLSPDIEFWQEVGPIKNARIEHCTFEKCGFTDQDPLHSALVVRASHNSGTVYPAGVHENITVRDNTFLASSGIPIYISATDGVVLGNNMGQDGRTCPAQVVNCTGVTRNDEAEQD